MTSEGPVRQSVATSARLVFQTLDGKPTVATTSTPYMTPTQMAERLGLPDSAARPATGGLTGITRNLEAMGEGSRAAVIGVSELSSETHWFNITFCGGACHVIDAYFGMPGPEQLFTENMWIIYGPGPGR